MELPPECEEILTRALAKAPGDRYPTADHFKAALEVLSGAAAAEMMPTLSLPSPAPLSSLDPTPWPPPLGITVTALKRAPGAETGIAPPVPSPGMTATALKPAPTAATGIAPPVPLPLPAPAAPPGRRMPLAAMIALGVVLLVGVPAVLMWRARAAKAESAISQASPPPVSAVAEAAPPVPPASGSVEAAPSAPPVPVAKPSASPAIAKTSGTPPPAAVGSPSGAVPATPSGEKTEAVPPAVSAPGTVPPPLPAVLPTVSFARMKLLVLDEGKSRDRDASLRLGPDALEVLDGERTIQSTRYADVLGFFHSHSREPRWATPNGAPVPVLKVGGKFGFLKGTPDWITVRTKDGFIPLRVRDEELGRVIAQLEARTGSKVVRVR
jgi:hypothetical protein